MSEELDTLREIGAQKIYEKTHISLKHVQSVIHESFEDLTKIQFLGFISILEREYNQDLSSLKEKGLQYFENESPKKSSPSSVFVEPKRSKKPTIIYIFIAVVVFIAVAYFTIVFNSSSPVVSKIDNTAIESAQKNINIVELNSTVLDENITEPLVVVIEPEVVVIPASLKIVAKSKLWLGYINRTDNIKKQMVIKEFLDLDPSKEWLITLGHGNVNIEINAEVEKFKTTNNVRFLYKEGKIERLTLEEFKKLNKGRAW